MEQPPDSAHRSLRVVLIEDDEDVRDLLEVMFDVDARFELVGTAGDGGAGVELARELCPDAVVLDLELPHVDGLATIPMLRAEVPDAAIVVFSAFPDPYTLRDVLQLGAATYVDKGAAWAELLPAIVTVCRFEFVGATSSNS